MSLEHDFLTPKQAAAYLQVSTQTIGRYIKLGLIKSSQAIPNGAVRISASSIEKMLEKSRQKISHSEVKA